MGKIKGVKTKQERQQKRDAHAQREERVEKLWKYGLAVAVAAFAAAIGLFVATNSAPYAKLSASEPERLQEVLFGGDPWLVLCEDSVPAAELSEAGALPPYWSEVASGLQSRAIAQSGVLDCSERLPSGKNTYDRLSLNTSKAPVLLLALGTDKPVQLNAQLLKKGLGKAVRERVKSRFGVRILQSSGELRKHCAERKACGLMIGAGELPENDLRNLVARTSSKHRDFRWAWINNDRFDFSLISKLPAASSAGEIRLMVFRRHPNATLELEPHERVLFAPYEGYVDRAGQIGGFLDTLEAGGIEITMRSLEKLPAMRVSKKKLRAKAAKDRSKSKHVHLEKKKSSAPRKSSVPPAKNPPTSRTQSKLTAREREIRRREEMDREAEESYAQAVNEEDVWDDDDDAEEDVSSDDEEDVLNLDDELDD